MKKFFYLLICLTLAACGSSKTASISSDTSSASGSPARAKISIQSVLSQMEKGRYVQGELLVKFKSGVSAKSLQKIHETVGAAVIKKYSLVSNLEHIKLPKGLSVKDAVMQYMSDPDVEYAEPNYIFHMTSPAPITSNDTYFPDQWALLNVGTYANGTYAADMKAALAWNISVGNIDIKIAVLDTGIDYNHPDLVGNIWQNSGETNCNDGIDNDGNGYIDDCKGWNFVTCTKLGQNNDPDNPGETCEIPAVPNNDPIDDYGHGTHVAGIIGAAGDNNMGVAGVMWQVSMMAIKVLNADGEGSSADVTAGIQYAVNNGARVINASLGGSEFSQSMYDVINAANSAGVLLVAAADQNDNLVAFSNFGPNSVDIAAPGTYIISTVPTWWAQYPGYGDLEMFSGTSMAAPYVSGVAGLLMSYYDGYSNTHFTLAQIRNTILGFNDVEADGYPGLKTLKGKIKTEGRLDAFWEITSLATPSDLVAEAKSPGLVDIMWTDNSLGEDGFKLERSTNGTTFSKLKTLDRNVTTYSDKSVSQGATYYYRVKAFNWVGESFYSNTSSTDVPVVHHSEGGGCSVGGRQNLPTAVADVAVLLIPLAIVALARRRR
jgi:subtilisin family serine protease